MAEKQVKCADCGLVSLRHTGTFEFLEVDRDWRRSADRHGPLGTAAETYPKCFVHEQDIRTECVDERRRRGDGPEAGIVLEIISRDRECARYFEWRQGFSPKEHVEMIYEEQKNRENKVWQEGMLAKQNEKVDELKSWYGGLAKQLEKLKWIYGMLGVLAGAIIALIFNKAFGVTLGGESTK